VTKSIKALEEVMRAAQAEYFLLTGNAIPPPMNQVPGEDLRIRLCAQRYFGTQGDHALHSQLSPRSDGSCWLVERAIPRAHIS